MKKTIISIFAAAAVFSCVGPNPDVNFGVEVGTEDGQITIGPEGGVTTIKVSSPGEWVVMTEEPWITVSPANGKGSTECTVSIDSTLTAVQRQGAVRIQSLDNSEDKHDFSIAQGGFELRACHDQLRHRRLHGASGRSG